MSRLVRPYPVSRIIYPRIGGSSTGSGNENGTPTQQLPSSFSTTTSQRTRRQQRRDNRRASNKKKQQQQQHHTPKTKGIHYEQPSLIHMWKVFYQTYLDAEYPRLMIRFEDTLYHPEKVWEAIVDCLYGPPSEEISQVNGTTTTREGMTKMTTMLSPITWNNESQNTTTKSQNHHHHHDQGTSNDIQNKNHHHMIHNKMMKDGQQQQQQQKQRPPFQLYLSPSKTDSTMNFISSLVKNANPYWRYHTKFRSIDLNYIQQVLSSSSSSSSS